MDESQVEDMEAQEADQGGKVKSRTHMDDAQAWWEQEEKTEVHRKETGTHQVKDKT